MRLVQASSRTRVVALSLLFPLALGVLASCGSDDSASDSTVAGTAADSATTATAGTTGDTDATGATGATGGDAGATDEVVIASVGAYSGPDEAYGKPGAAGLQAWADSVNAKGGINGHKVKLIVEDTRADTTRARTLIQDLVENQGVVAFVGNFDGTAQGAAADYLLENGIPVLGGEHGPPVWWENPMFFPFGADTNYQGYGYIAAAKLFSDGRDLATLVCEEAPGCDFVGKGMASQGEAAGYNVVYQGRASLAAPDFTAQCVAAKDAGANVVFLAFSFDADRHVASDCSRQGLEPTYIVASGDDSFVDDEAFEGYVTATPAFPPYYDGPETKDFHDAMAEYQPDSPVTPLSSMGWVIGLGMEKVLSGIDGPVTSEAILDQLWTFEDETFGGLSAPLTFIEDQPAPVTKCTFPVVQRDGAMVAPNGLEQVCGS
jgi:branched-chain amino acid transport system substrate-binding protein